MKTILIVLKYNSMKKEKKNQENYLDELEKTRKKDTFIEKTEVENNNSESKQEESKGKKKFSKYPIFIVIILIITGITMGISLSEDWNGIVTTFSSMDYTYFIYGALCFIGVFLVNSLILFLFARRYRKKYYFHQAMANDIIGNFYNCITPSASGGQPMQAYTFKKQGIPLSNATSCLVMNFIVYQAVMIVIATIAVICKSGEVFAPGAYDIVITDNFSIPFWIVMVLGYALQFIVIFGMILMSTSRKFHNLILNQGVNLFAKMKIVKKPDEARKNLAVSIDSFKVELKNLLINPRFLILIVILHVGCFALRYSIPHFINQSVLGTTLTQAGAYKYTWWDTFCYTSIHKMATELIPIPGAAGVSELFYYSVFREAFDNTVLLANYVGATSEDINQIIKTFTNLSQVLWRVVTFHVPLVISTFVAVFYKGKPSIEETKAASKGATTYLTLTIDTFDERRKTYQTIYNTKQINKREFEKWKKEHAKNRKEEDK